MWTQDLSCLGLNLYITTCWCVTLSKLLKFLVLQRTINPLKITYTSWPLCTQKQYATIYSNLTKFPKREEKQEGIS